MRQDHRNHLASNWCAERVSCQAEIHDEREEGEGAVKLRSLRLDQMTAKIEEVASDYIGQSFDCSLDLELRF